ncbi:MAG: twin-arginine translocase TatA/TatE family subunit [Alphaproteobacteria bacterium]|jgi:sec-independent protein translocase protein TatA|nr:twin-arginine translocase TatA/TatE family subunit [Alphaproteobacteria bacterium]
MGSIGFWQIIIILIIVVIIFGGKGKISSVLSDVAKGLKNFRNEISDDDSKNKENKDNS